jgi:glycosyltransferase involved in cell wall biosynthesis
MRVCIISDFTKTGGAATAANRIARSFFENGCEVHRISSDGCMNSKLQEHVLDVSRKFKVLSMFSNYSIISPFLPRLRKGDLLGQLNKKLSLIKPDWINLHNFHGADWPLELAEVCLDHAPSSWTLHDCSTFLGSYYPSHCPAPSPLKSSNIDNFWTRLSKNKFKDSLSFIAPSKWMKKSAQTSYWNKFKSSVIPYPIFSDFNPTDNKIACREALSLDPKLPTVLAAAGDLNEARKGGEFLKSIILEEKFKNTQFLLFGKLDWESDLPPNARSLGFIQDEELKRIAYCSADLTLHPAPIDNLPNTVIESIACNTPVLAFATGGLPDMINPERTGWLVDEISFEALSAKLQNVLNHRAFESSKLSFSTSTDETFNPSKVFEQHMTHFKSERKD